MAEYLLFGAGVTLLNHTEDRYTGHILIIDQSVNSREGGGDERIAGSEINQSTRKDYERK